jgi:hypothetical protein
MAFPKETLCSNRTGGARVADTKSLNPAERKQEPIAMEFGAPASLLITFSSLSRRGIHAFLEMLK